MGPYIDMKLENYIKCKRATRKMYRAVFVFCCLANGVVIGKNETRSASVPIESVPFLAALLAPRGGLLEHYCSAAVIHEKFVLTAASCFVAKEWDVTLTKVLVGTSNLHRPGQLLDVETLVPHPKYFVETGDFNVGLVKVSQRLHFGRKVGQGALGGKVAVGDVVNVAGWGRSAGLPTNKLRQASIPVLRRKSCTKGLGRVTSPRLMCAGANGTGKGDCVSDEGGPVYQNRTLLAVVTPYTGCGRLPGLYTRLSAVLGWVTATIEENLSYLDYLDEVVPEKGVRNLL